jgi:hypothetical protein
MNQGALTRKDRLRIEMAVRRVDWTLDGRVPMAKRRQIRHELRSNLIEAARQVGAERAIQQLGDLRALASSYLDLYRGRFDFQAGSVWAVITYAATEALGIVLLIAFHAGVAAGGSHGGSYSFEFWPGSGPFQGTAAANGNGFEVLLLSPAHFLLMLVAFLIGSSYRALFARRAKS